MRIRFSFLLLWVNPLLFENAFHRSDWNAALWMWHGNSPLFRRMLEVMMASDAGDLEPAVSLNHLYDFL